MNSTGKLSSLRHKLRFRSSDSSRQVLSPGLSSSSLSPPGTSEIKDDESPFGVALQNFIDELPAPEATAFRHAYRNVTPESLCAKLRDIDEADRRDTGRRHLGQVERFLSVLDRLMSGVSIGIQHSPEISSLVVGGARLILDIALKYVEFFQRLTTSINRLGDHLVHLEEYAQHKEAVSVQKAVAEVYGGLLRFYHQAHRTFLDANDQPRKYSHLKRLMRVQWEPFDASFGAIDNDICHQLNVLQHSALANILSTVLKLDGDQQNSSVGDMQRKHAEDRKLFLEWISPSDFTGIQEITLGKRWPGTGSWIFSTKEFEQWWSENAKSCFLWCRGPPGSGKSVLFSSIVDHVSSLYVYGAKSTRVGHAYAYFRYDQVDKQSPQKIIAALIKQLAQQLDPLPDKILSGFFQPHYKNAQTPTVKSSSDAFILLAQQFDQVLLAIDALDECGEEAQPTVLEFLYDVSVKAPQTKLLVTSRPEASITGYFSALGVPTIEITPKSTRNDVSIFIDGRLKKLTAPSKEGERPNLQSLRVKSPKTVETISKTLTRHADGMILWVNLQLNELCRQKSDDDMLQVLHALPRGINATYARIFEQLSQEAAPLQQVALKAVMWVMTSSEPLTERQLMEAIAVHGGCDSESLLLRRRDSYSREDILDSCRNLLVFEPNHHGGGVFRLVHYSLAEFLRNHPESCPVPPPFSTLSNINMMHAIVAMACMDYIQLLLYESPECKPREIFHIEYKYPLAEFCVDFFDMHMRWARDSSTVAFSTLRQLLSMSQAALTTLAEWKYQEWGNVTDIKNFPSINARFIVMTTQLSEIPYVRDDSQWNSMEIHPLSLSLVCADYDGTVGQVKRLLDAGAACDFVDDSGRTPFTISFMCNTMDISLALLDAGADANRVIPGPGVTALEYAANHHDLALVEMLLSHGDWPESTVARAVRVAKRRNNMDVVECLVKNYPFTKDPWAR